MNKDLIKMLFEALDAEQAKLTKARADLQNLFHPGAVTNAGKPKRRLSASARSRISKAQKQRWAAWQKKNRKAA